MPGASSCSGLLDGHAVDDDFLLRRTIARSRIRARSASISHFLEDIQTRRYCPERRVIRPKGAVLVHQEELAPIGAGPTAVRHRNGSGLVGRLRAVRCLLGWQAR